MSFIPGWVQVAATMPCVILSGGDPYQTIVISDNPPTNVAAVNSTADPLLTQEATDAAIQATNTTNLANFTAAVVNAFQANQTFITNAASVTFPLSNANQQALVNQVVALTKQLDMIGRVVFGALSSTVGT
jgi:hypothetical protein